MDVLREKKWLEDAMFWLSPHEVPARNPSAEMVRRRLGAVKGGGSGTTVHLPIPRRCAGSISSY